MENKIFIPKKIKAGYQRRSDTYSKKLAYVIYYDSTGKLRKENSWKGWIDEKLGFDDFENVPTEGFVLNKNVGGVRESYGSDDVRIEKVRVYDPRGFEFEIDIPNVLTILQECTSVKGKGLDGTFVYGWSGTNLVLIPTDCQQYKESIEYTSLRGNKLSSKELINGCSYKTKDGADLVYLGKLDWFEYNYRKEAFESKKQYVFVDENPDFFNDYEVFPEEFETEEEYQEELKRIQEEKELEIQELNESGKNVEFLHFSNLNKISICNSEVPVNNYAELIEKFSSTKNASKPVGFVEEGKIEMPKEKFNHYWTIDCKRDAFLKIGDNKYRNFNIEFQDGLSFNSNKKPQKIVCSPDYDYYIDSNKGVVRDYLGYGSIREIETKTFNSLSEIEKMNFVKLSVALENNRNINIEDLI